MNDCPFQEIAAAKLLEQTRPGIEPERVFKGF